MGDDGNLEALPDFELAIPRKRGPQLFALQTCVGCRPDVAAVP